MTIAAKNGVFTASGIGFFALAALAYGSALGILIKSYLDSSSLLDFSKYSHAKLVRISNVNTFDPNDPNIDPALARDFVAFVVSDALDAKPSTALTSHQKSKGWMKFQVSSTMDDIFWSNPKISKLCFVTTSAQSHTKKAGPVITVTLNGYFHDHKGASQIHFPMELTFDVVKSKTGLRLKELAFSDEAFTTLNRFAN